MPHPRLATPYAKSLIGLSIEQVQLEYVFADMQWLQKIIKGNRDFLNLLRSPIIKADKKQKIMDAVLGGKISNITFSFIRLLIGKGRESNLPEIITAFVNKYKAYKNIHTVKLTTATTVDENLKNAIVSQIKKTSDMQNIELETKIDENLIGGFVLQSGDKLIDASIAYELKQIEKQFDNN